MIMAMNAAMITRPPFNTGITSAPLPRVVITTVSLVANRMQYMHETANLIYNNGKKDLNSWALIGQSHSRNAPNFEDKFIAIHYLCLPRPYKIYELSHIMSAESRIPCYFLLASAISISLTRARSSSRVISGPTKPLSWISRALQRRVLWYASSNRG